MLVLRIRNQGFHIMLHNTVFLPRLNFTSRYTYKQIWTWCGCMKLPHVYIIIRLLTLVLRIIKRISVWTWNLQLEWPNNVRSTSNHHHRRIWETLRSSGERNDVTRTNLGPADSWYLFVFFAAYFFYLVGTRTN